MKIIMILTLLSFFSSKNEPICILDENNAGKEIYDLNEATCFIALKLEKKKSALKFIREALIAEENYMIKMGLISENPNPANETEASAEMDINKLVEYAIKEENVDLTPEELLEIYDTEVEYLIFIGVAGE